jgi:hypothetical protein
VHKVTYYNETSGRIRFVDEIFRNLIESNFSDLRGLTVDASVPVPQQLVNEIIAAVIQGNANIHDFEAIVHRQNRVSINLKTPLWPWPLELKLRLDDRVDFSGSPKIRAWLESNILLARIGSSLKALPAGISIHHDQVLADIESFLSTPEQKRLLGWIRSVEIKTDEGKMIFDIKILVDE